LDDPFANKEVADDDDDFIPNDQKSSELSAFTNENKRIVIKGTLLTKYDKYKIKKCSIEKLDRPTACKLLEKCKFKRITPGPIKLDIR